LVPLYVREPTGFLGRSVVRLLVGQRRSRRESKCIGCAGSQGAIPASQGRLGPIAACPNSERSADLADDFGVPHHHACLPFGNRCLDASRASRNPGQSRDAFVCFGRCELHINSDPRGRFVAIRLAVHPLQVLFILAQRADWQIAPKSTAREQLCSQRRLTHDWIRTSTRSKRGRDRDGNRDSDGTTSSQCSSHASRVCHQRRSDSWDHRKGYTGTRGTPGLCHPPKKQSGKRFLQAHRLRPPTTSSIPYL